MMTCLRWILGSMRLEIWRKIGLSADYVTSLHMQRYALLVVHATLGLGMFNRFDGMIRVTDRWTDRRQHIKIAHSLVHFAICSVATHKLVDGFEV